MPNFPTKLSWFFTGTIVTAIVLSFVQQKGAFFKLSPQKMHQRLISERDFAIQKAVEAGVYQCCIKPPCTMCYWEGNRWNNYTAGTCDCDNLIAKGQEPCPQCVAGLCQKSADGTCEVSKN